MNAKKILKVVVGIPFVVVLGVFLGWMIFNLISKTGAESQTLALNPEPTGHKQNALVGAINLETGATSVDVLSEEVVWKTVQVALFVPDDGWIEVDGAEWELPLGTHFAVSIKNGRYEAVQSVTTGRDENDWCGDDQFDCPPHAVLVRVEVPEDLYGCVTPLMDISWRIITTSTCGHDDAPVPVRYTLRTNDQTRSGNEILEDYLSLVGLKLPFRTDFTSEVGVFVAAKNPGDLIELTFGESNQSVGYSCWDCLADSRGPGQPIPYELSEGFETFGPDTAPLGSSLEPGVVFVWDRPMNGEVQTLTFETLIFNGRPSVVWIGRWDVESQ